MCLPSLPTEAKLGISRSRSSLLAPAHLIHACSSIARPCRTYLKSHFGPRFSRSKICLHNMIFLHLDVPAPFHFTFREDSHEKETAMDNLESGTGPRPGRDEESTGNSLQRMREPQLSVPVILPLRPPTSSLHADGCFTIHDQSLRYRSSACQHSTWLADLMKQVTAT